MSCDFSNGNFQVWGLENKPEPGEQLLFNFMLISDDWVKHREFGTILTIHLETKFEGQDFIFNKTLKKLPAIEPASYFIKFYFSRGEVEFKARERIWSTSINGINLYNNLTILDKENNIVLSFPDAKIISQEWRSK